MLGEHLVDRWDEQRRLERKRAGERIVAERHLGRGAHLGSAPGHGHADHFGYCVRFRRAGLHLDINLASATPSISYTNASASVPSGSITTTHGPAPLSLGAIPMALGRTWGFAGQTDERCNGEAHPDSVTVTCVEIPDPLDALRGSSFSSPATTTAQRSEQLSSMSATSAAIGRSPRRPTFKDNLFSAACSKNGSQGTLDLEPFAPLDHRAGPDRERSEPAEVPGRKELKDAAYRLGRAMATNGIADTRHLDAFARARAGGHRCAVARARPEGRGPLQSPPLGAPPLERHLTGGGTVAVTFVVTHAPDQPFVKLNEPPSDVAFPNCVSTERNSAGVVA